MSIVFQRIFFALLLIFTSSCMSKYASELSTFYKVGESHIGRLSYLQPLNQGKNKLIFSNMILMLDSNNTVEGNIGLGYRQLRGSEILGSYLYYDIRRTFNKNTVHQFTLGFEYLRELFEVRLNGYVPLKKKFVLSTERKFGELSHDTSKVFIETSTVSMVERAYHGLDVELGVTSESSLLNLYLGCYYFRASSREMLGPQIRLESKPLDCLTLSAEFKHDKIRGTKFYVGLGIRFSMGSKNKSPYGLKSKMTQMPVRDIEAITSVSSEIESMERDDLALVRDVAGFRAAMLSKEQYIGIADDIDFGDDVIDIYGSQGSPLKDLYITGIDVEIVNGSIVSISQEHKELRNFILPANPGETILINGETKVIPIGIFNAIEDSDIGYLRVNNWSSTNSGDMASGLVGLSKGKTNIHHNINLSNMVENKAGLVGIGIDNTIVQFNENRGNMVVGGTRDLYSAGIILIGAGNTIVQDNTAYGITRGLSGGVLLESYDDVLVQKNSNISRITLDHSGAIIFKSYNQSNILYNTNKSRLGSNCAGTVRTAHNMSKVENNSNEGEVRDDAAGITLVSFDNSKIHYNKNFGLISGDFGSGILSGLRNNSSAIGNINIALVTGDDTGPIIRGYDTSTTVNNNYWQIYNDPADRNLPVVFSTPTFNQAEGGALTRQELIDRKLI